MTDLIKENFLFFENEILPYYILLYTSTGVIVVDTKPENLKHLLGIDKTANLKYKKMSAFAFYNHLKEYDIELFELIRKKEFYEKTLSQDELFIYRKNYVFTEVFESFLSNTNISIYIRRPGDLFDSDYVHFCWIGKSGGYIGIIGSDKNNYHYFDSVMLETDNPKKYIGPKILVKKIERIPKEKFDINRYKISTSKRFVKKKKFQNNKTKKIDLKKLQSSVKKLLNDDIEIRFGTNGNNTYEIRKNGKVVEPKYRPAAGITTAEEIAQYINDTYN